MGSASEAQSAMGTFLFKWYVAKFLSGIVGRLGHGEVLGGGLFGALTWACLLPFSGGSLVDNSGCESLSRTG